MTSPSDLIFISDDELPNPESDNSRRRARTRPDYSYQEFVDTIDAVTIDAVTIDEGNKPPFRKRKRTDVKGPSSLVGVSNLNLALRDALGLKIN